MTEDRFENMIAKIVAWMGTPEGKLRMAKLETEIGKFTKQLEEQEKVSDEDLHKRIDC
jgi:uncharacterized protein YheU (UPF0270 family)